MIEEIASFTKYMAKVGLIMRVIAIIATLIAVGLAGCADSDGNANDTGLSAAQGMESSAMAWSPSAELVYLESLEYRSDNPFAGAGAPTPEIGAVFTTVLDEPVGDGRSSLWVGVYRADGETMMMFWTPNRVVFENVTDNVPAGNPIDISKIVVDSHEAAEILAANDANWTAVQDELEVFGAATLLAVDGELYWNFIALSEERNLSGVVNAVTGNITEGLTVEPESISGSLGITPGGSTSGSFVLDNSHSGLMLNFAKSGGEPLIGPAIDVIVTDPTGETYSFSVLGANNQQVFPGLAGEWQITASSNDLVLAATLNYSGFTLE